MKYLIIVLTLLIVYGCRDSTKTQKLKTIVVSPAETTEANLSEIAESVQLIPLETNDSCLVSYITNIDVCDNYVFINSGGTVMQFDTDGKFIRKIGREGRGPKEYMYAGNIACNDQNHTIYIASQQKILCYDFKGNYISTIKHNQLIEYITVADNQLLAFYTKYGEKVGDKMMNRAVANIYSNDGKLVDSLKIKDIIIEKFTGSINPIVHYLSRTTEQNYFYYPVLLREEINRDTLYQFTNDHRFIPRFKINFGINNVEEIKRKKLLIKNMYRTDRYLFVEYRYQREPQLFCCDLKNNTQYNTANGFYDDLHHTANLILYPIKNTPNLMYAIRNAYEISDKIEGIDENDNPVLMLVKLKE